MGKCGDLQKTLPLQRYPFSHFRYTYDDHCATGSDLWRDKGGYGNLQERSSHLKFDKIIFS